MFCSIYIYKVFPRRVYYVLSNLFCYSLTVPDDHPESLPTETQRAWPVYLPILTKYLHSSHREWDSAQSSAEEASRETDSWERC